MLLGCQDACWRPARSGAGCRADRPPSPRRSSAPGRDGMAAGAVQDTHGGRAASGPAPRGSGHCRPAPGQDLRPAWAVQDAHGGRPASGPAPRRHTSTQELNTKLPGPSPFQPAEAPAAPAPPKQVGSRVVSFRGLCSSHRTQGCAAQACGPRVASFSRVVSNLELAGRHRSVVWAQIHERQGAAAQVVDAGLHRPTRCTQIHERQGTRMQAVDAGLHRPTRWAQSAKA